MSAPQIRFYTAQELELLAETFIKEFHKPPESIPVEIDLIVQRDLHIDILPFSCLESKYGLHGYLALSLKTIYIEQYIMDVDNFERRYRFILAEEIAHLILHKELFSGVKEPEDYFKALDKITEFEHGRMDLDAKRLAEGILLPAEIFRKETLRVLADLPKTNEPPIIKRMKLFYKLADMFNISEEAISYRYRHLGLSTQFEV